MKKILNFAKQHKIISGLIILAIIIGGYLLFKGKDAVKTTYVLAAVEKGTLITSVAGSGQVSSFNQVDLKAKISGEITAVLVKAGAEVKAGALLAQIDASDAYKTVRDARTALETARLDLEEALAPVDKLTLMQAEDSVSQAEQSKETAEDNLEKAYEDGFNTVANAFLDLPSVMTGLNDVLFAYNYNSTQNNLDYYAGAIKTYNDDSGATYRDDAYSKYQTARAAYNKNFSDYKTASRFSDKTVIENLILETYETTKNIAEAVKSANNLIRLYQDKLTERSLTPQTLSTTHLTNLSTYTGKTNTYLTSLLSAKSSIQAYKDTIETAERTIIEKQLSFEDTKAGTAELTLRAKRLAVQQKEDALASAEETLSDCYVRAPFDGVVAAVSVKRGDSVSSGGTVATIITKQSIAEMSLNEVDAAKVKAGQKATMTFDAVEELTVTGRVAEVDTLGTVSSGVVTYGVKISLDTQDAQIKSGMTTSITIVTEAKTDVLMIASSAIKFSGDGSYVETPDETTDAATGSGSLGITLIKTPKKQQVEIGISNDSYTEITSGLNEGDQIIIKTITGSSSKSSTVTTKSNNSILQSGGMGGPPGM